MVNPFLPVLNALLPEPHASLLSGILFGTKASMPRSFTDSLVTTGTLHIIALSGMNISILTSITAKMTLFLGRKASSIVTMCLIVLFVLFVGPSPSVVRAAIMGSFSLLAICFGRQSWGLLSLVLSAGIMLLFDFSLMENLSFQLSFLATFGIILANKGVECEQGNGILQQSIFFLKENFRTTISAQIFTVPVILYHFHRISLIAPIANVAIEWVVQPIMILGFITSIIGFIWLPLGFLPAWITWVPLTYLITVVELLAKVPGAAIQF